MSYTTLQFQDFLTKIAPFNQIPPDAIAELAQKLKPWRYQMGQVILMRDKNATHVSILFEGQARLLGYDPRTKMPSTLQLLQPGDILGWVNVVRGIPCETAIASTEAICLTFSQEDFSALLAQYPAFQVAFDNQCSFLELFDVLGLYLEQQAQGEGDLKQLASNALEQARVYYLPPGISYAAAHAALQNPEMSWLVSGGGAIANFPKGSRILPNTHDETIEVIDSPARLIGIPSHYLREEPVTPTGELLYFSQTLAAVCLSIGDWNTALRVNYRFVFLTLIQYLSDKDEKIRLASVNALGQIRDEEAVPALCKVLAQDPHPEVRRSAAEALGMIGSQETGAGVSGNQKS